MKKFLLLAFTIPGFLAVQAQEPADALRGSWYTPTGTARAQAVGGAMGSLGGDLTALFVNPAGLGFYRTGDFVFTPMYSFGKTKASYLGKEASKNNERFTWGATGFVVGGNTGGKNRSAAFSIGFTRTADFNNHFLYQGVNYKSSFSQQYTELLQNNNIRNGNTAALDFQYGLSQAFNTYWIDTVGGGTNGNFQFQSRAAALAATGLIQRDSIVTRGGVNEFAMGFAVNMNDKLFLGGSVGVPIMYYERDREFIEADSTSNRNNNFDYAIFRENFTTRGVGLNLKLGLIYKPSEFWRLGFAFHSPTLYRLTDAANVTVTTDTEGYKGEQTQNTGDVLRDKGSGSNEFKYLQVTPYRFIGSISYVLRETQDVTKQRGFITADVEYVNHKATSYMEDADEGTSGDNKAYLRALNNAIDNAYKSTFNFRVGAELKFTTIMVRAGAAYYGNPYRDIRGESGNRVNLSGGLGYRNKGFFIDMTYVHALNKDVNFAYRLQNGDYSGANLNTTRGTVLATVGVKF